MREIQAKIQISAPPERVWQVLTDLSQWSAWNPIVSEVRGTATPGAKLRVTMKGKNGQAGGSYQPTILELKAPHRLQWRGTMMAGFLMTNDKILELEPHDGGTLLTHRETFYGLMVPLFWSKMEQWVPSMLQTMNKALKTRAEG